jgi:hypothetical protein
LHAFWEDLGGDDAKKAYQAIRAFAQAPKEAVQFLTSKMKPATTPDAKRVTQLVKSLNDEQFTVRENAFKELESLAELAEPALRAAMAASQPLEARRRLERLLAQLDAPTVLPERRREARVVETLEMIGTPEAKELLEAWGRGAPLARLTKDARESLERLRSDWAVD